MHKTSEHGTTDGTHDREATASDSVSAAWVLFLIGIALLLILRTI